MRPSFLKMLAVVLNSDALCGISWGHQGGCLPGNLSTCMRILITSSGATIMREAIPENAPAAASRREDCITLPANVPTRVLTSDAVPSQAAPSASRDIGIVA